jgi:hypothetical protein
MLTTRPRRRFTPSTERRQGVTPVAVLSLAALGVVFGDIGTSPLYVFRRLCFLAGPGYAARAENVLGILSLIVWALILVVCVKYATFVLRADYEGEGGTCTRNSAPKIATVAGTTTGCLRCSLCCWLRSRVAASQSACRGSRLYSSSEPRCSRVTALSHRRSPCSRPSKD